MMLFMDISKCLDMKVQTFTEKYRPLGNVERIRSSFLCLGIFVGRSQQLAIHHQLIIPEGIHTSNSV